MTEMAHENEYLGAVAGMQETYGTGWKDTSNTPKQEHAVGDFVSGLTAGRRWSGRVEWFSDDGVTLVVNIDGAWIRCPVADITH